jgi:hypothetical protein
VVRWHCTSPNQPVSYRDKDTPQSDTSNDAEAMLLTRDIIALLCSSVNNWEGQELREQLIQAIPRHLARRSWPSIDLGKISTVRVRMKSVFRRTGRNNGGSTPVQEPGSDARRGESTAARRFHIQTGAWFSPCARRTQKHTQCSGRKIPLAFCGAQLGVNTGTFAVFTPKDRRSVHLSPAARLR